MHILIVRNNSNPAAVEASHELAAHFRGRGIGYTACDAFDLPRQPGKPIDCAPAGEELDAPEPDGGMADLALVVVLGGDGTVLRAASMAGTSGVPLLGINFGHLGFLSNPSDDGVVRVVEAALAGHVVREDRSNLHIEASRVSAGADGAEEQRVLATYFALNELAITRGNLGRVVNLSVAVNGDKFMTIRGDGVVLASATGSTAYALSAGGPVVSPAHRGMVMVPLAPHSLRSRAAVTAQGEVVTIDLADDDATQSSSFFVDGALVERTGRVDRFTVRIGTRPTTLLRYDYGGFHSRAAQTFL